MKFFDLSNELIIGWYREFDSFLNELFLMKKSGSLDSPKHNFISYFSLSPKENSLPTQVFLNMFWAFSQSKKFKAFIKLKLLIGGIGRHFCWCSK